MKPTLIPCRITGCKHEPFSSAQGELMHYHRAHSGRIKVINQSNRRAAPNGTLLSSDRKPGLELPKPKRVYRQRKLTALTSTTKPSTARSVEINFCPRCVTPLHPVAVGMVLAKANSAVNGCPNCGLDLKLIALGIAQHSHHV